MNKFFLVLLFLFSIGFQLSSQTKKQQQEYKILGISVVGNKSSETAAIIANAGLNIGDVLNVPGEQTRTAITRLWGLKIFSDIQIDVENFVGDGVYLLIKVEEHPRLDKVEFRGTDELSEDDLLKKINVLKGQIISPQEINKMIKVMKKAYEEDGYLQAQITSEIVPSADTAAHGKVVLRFHVDEGSDVRIGKIVFYGNKFFSSDDLKDEMGDTHEKKWWKFWRTGKLEKKKYVDDKKKLIQFYKKNGFRDAELMSDSIDYTISKDRMALKLFIYEGPQYKIRNITWEGNTVFKTEALNARLGMTAGEMYNMEKFERNLRSNEEQSDVSSLYLDNGYLTMQVEPEETKVGGDSLDIVIKIREHNQFRIGKVDIRGNNKTQERVIRRELYSRPGDYFSRSNIIRSIRQLSVLNYFNPEKIKPDTRFVDDKNVDVVFDVEEKSSDTFNASVGYSGAFGFTGAIGLTFNNFYLAEPFSGGGGQVLNFDWQFGGGSLYTMRTVSLSFREPWMFNTRTSFGFSLYDTETKYTYQIHQTGGTVSLGRRFTFPDDYFSGSWTLRIQKLDVTNGGFYYGNTGKSNQFSITQVISRNSINSPLFPSQGSNIALTTELSGSPFLPGDVSYSKHIFSTDWYVPLFNSARVALYLGSQFGSLVKFNNTDSKIPPIEYFNMGGTGIGYVNTTQLRGYEDRSIGVGNLSYGEYGGTVMEKVTAELRFNVSLNPIPIYFLAFAEGGNVWDRIGSAELFDLKRSAGLGARLLINPIGLLGFDYGYGFDSVVSSAAGVPIEPSGWKFHFQFGRGF